MIQWQLQPVAIKLIKPYKKNPRQISKDRFSQLQGLIQKFGLIDKPILNQDMTLICGHQRLKILKKMKVKQVECQIPDRLLDEKEVEELLIGHNLIQGNFDYDILANEWDAIDLLKYGFTEEQLLGYFEEKENIQDEESENSKEKKLKKCPECGHEFS
jgi:ParB-like chromosome segregation protein Spo0J